MKKTNQNPDILPKFQKVLEIERKQKQREKIHSIFMGIIVVLTLLSSTPFGREFWEDVTIRTKLNPFYSASQDMPLNIHFIDVGKADAILIECEGESLLLDGGTYDKGQKISDYLWGLKIEDLDRVAISHTDKDHVGGLSQVIQEHDTAGFLQPEISAEIMKRADSYLSLTKVLDEQGVPSRTLAAGDEIPIGDAVLSVLAPLENYKDSNNSSLVCKLSYGDFSALFCGDIEKEAEMDLLDSGVDLSADLLKVAHHGSKTSTTKKFLVNVDPQYAVVSVGPDRNNLPDGSVMERIERRNIEIYETDLDGTVLFSVGQNGDVVVTTEK